MIRRNLIDDKVQNTSSKFNRRESLMIKTQRHNIINSEDIQTMTKVHESKDI